MRSHSWKKGKRRFPFPRRTNDTGPYCQPTADPTGIPVRPRIPTPHPYPLSLSSSPAISVTTLRSVTFLRPNKRYPCTVYIDCALRCDVSPHYPGCVCTASSQTQRHPRPAEEPQPPCCRRLYSFNKHTAEHAWENAVSGSRVRTNARTRTHARTHARTHV